MSKQEAVLAWFAGLAVLIVILAILYSIFVQGYLTARYNNEKVRQLTEYCVAHGYDGFTDDTSDNLVGCYKN